MCRGWRTRSATWTTCGSSSPASDLSRSTSLRLSWSTMHGWMDPTVPPSLLVCNRRPSRSLCQGEEVMSQSLTEAICEQHVACAVWTANFLLKALNLGVHPDPIGHRRSLRLSSMWPGEQSSSLTTDCLWKWHVSGLCIIPGVLSQQFSQTPLNMKDHVNPDSCSQPFPSCGYVIHPHQSQSIAPTF